MVPKACESFRKEVAGLSRPTSQGQASAAIVATKTGAVSNLEYRRVQAPRAWAKMVRWTGQQRNGRSHAAMPKPAASSSILIATASGCAGSIGWVRARPARLALRPGRILSLTVLLVAADRLRLQSSHAKPLWRHVLRGSW